MSRTLAEVELALGASLTADPSTWTWTRITQYVMDGQRVAITRGRPDGFATSAPSSARMALLNDGRFVPRNPNGAYYGQLRRNTPLRVLVRPSTNAQADSFTRTTSSSLGTADSGGAWTVVGTAADYSTTGTTARVTMGTTNVRHYAVLPATLTTADIRLRAKTAVLVTGLALGVGAVIRYADANNSIRGEIWFNADTTLTARIVTRVAGVDNVVASAVVPNTTHSAGTFFRLRVQTVGTTGQAGGQQIRVKAWQDGASEPDAWATQATVAVVTTAGQMGFTTIRETGNTNANATIDVDDYSLVDGARQRFTGYVKEWPTSWMDAGAKTALATITAAGLIQRLGQGAVLKSAMRRSYGSYSPLAYWPLEDAAGAQFAANAVSSGKPMLPGFAAIKFSSVPGPAGSLALPDLGTALETLRGPVPASAATSWRVELAVKVNPLPTGFSAVPIEIYTTGGVGVWQIDISPTIDAGSTYLRYTLASGVPTNVHSGLNLDDGYWHWLRVDVAQSGSDLTFDMYIDGQATATSGTLVGTAFGGVTSVTVCPIGTAAQNPNSVGHVVVWAPAPASNTYLPFLGNASETADARITRLGVEESLPLIATATSSTLMGAQGTSTVLEVLRTTENSDQGIMYDGLAGHLTLRPHDDRNNRSVDMALSVNAGTVAWPFSGTDDDQLLRNDVTATNSGGSSARYTVTTGDNGTTNVGTYADTLAVNIFDDSLLLQSAAWRAWIGTVSDLRYPELTINLTDSTSIVESWLNCDIGSRISVAGMPRLTVLPTDDLDLHLEGYTEVIENALWFATLNTSPAKPWQTIALDGAGNSSRLGSDASTLAAGVSTSATSLSVATAATSPLWSTTAPPFDVTVGGDTERITVTAISGSSSPQTFTVTRGVNGISFAKAINATVDLYRPGVLAL